MKLNILVCVKQVPDTAEIRTDPKTGNLLREGLPAVVNPYDKYALELALRIKDEHPGVKVTMVSMGPRQAEAALRQCLAMGADKAVLLSDRAFGGADTLATSYVLARAVRHLGAFDLILCGRQAIDGDTAQTGPALAEQLGWPQVTLVKELQVSADRIRATRETSRGTEVWQAALPALVTVTKPGFEPRVPTLRASLAAKRAAVTVLALDDIAADPARCGLRGSPTAVRKTYTLAAKKACVFARDANELVALLLQQKSRPKQEQASHVQATPHKATDVWAWLESPAETALLHQARQLAGKLGTGLAAILLGHEITQAAQALRGADRVIFMDDPAFAQYHTESCTAAMHLLVEKHKPGTLLFPASCNGRDLAPRLACRLQTGLTADCTGLDLNPQSGRVQWIRPAFCGKLMAVIECKTNPQMGTVRTAGGELSMAGAPAEVIQESVPDLPVAGAQLLERQDALEQGDALSGAEIIVAGGRGMDFALLRELAAALGGCVAGSRAAADEGLIPRARQVGQTGTMVSPKLYIACGISGAAQHVAGITGAGTVVAINSDPEAAIFDVADIGIVGDAREIVPAMIKLLQPIQ